MSHEFSIIISTTTGCLGTRGPKIVDLSISKLKVILWLAGVVCSKIKGGLGDSRNPDMTVAGGSESQPENSCLGPSTRVLPFETSSALSDTDFEATQAPIGTRRMQEPYMELGGWSQSFRVPELGTAWNLIQLYTESRIKDIVRFKKRGMRSPLIITHRQSPKPNPSAP